MLTTAVRWAGVFVCGMLILLAAPVSGGGTDNGAVATVDYVIGEPAARVPPGPRADWQGFETGRSLGFVAEPVWMRVRFDPEVLDGALRYLVIQPIHLDDVAVYAASGEPRPILQAGDRWPPTDPAVRYGYSVLLEESHLRDGLMIRLESANIMTPRVMVLTPGELQRENTQFFLLFSVAFSATLFYLFWAVAATIGRPSPLLIVWAARLAFYLVVLVVHLGLLRAFLDGEALPSQDRVHNLTALAYISLAQVFDFLLLQELGLRRRLAGLFLVVVLGFALGKTAAFVSGDTSLALQLNNLSALVTLVLGFGLIPLASARHRSVYPIRRGAIALYFLLQALPLVALYYAAAIESVGFGTLLELGFVAYAIVPAGYVTYVLFRRQRLLAHERVAWESAAREAAMRARAEREKREEVGRLLGMLIHEIRTPLGTLRMGQRMRALRPEVVERAIGNIDHALGQAGRVEEIDEGKLLPLPESVHLRELLVERALDLGLDVTIEGDTPPARADPDLLKVVLNNLLGNAAKYRSPGTSVVASLDADADGVVLQLGNTVLPGWSPDPERAFEKYYRQSNARSKPGTGLGLFIVRQLCERMGVEVSMTLEANWLVVSLRVPFAERTSVGGVQ